MKKILLSLFLFFTCANAHAQSTAQQVYVGTLTTSGCAGSLSPCFVPVSSTNPMYGTIIGTSGATSWYVYTSNGPGVAATFQPNSGGSVTISPYSVYGNNTASSAAGSSIQSLILGTPAFTDTGTLAQLTSSVAGYNQLIVQNTNTGATASANVIVQNNSGTATTFYGEFGMNSSNFTGTGSFNAASMVYLDTVSADLSLGTMGSNAIHFVVNNGATDAMRITTTGTVGIGTATPRNSSTLDVNGGLNVSAAGVFLTGLTTGTNADFLCLGASGQVFLQSSSCTISKRAFKENIYPLNDSALEEVMAFNPVQFNMKKQIVDGKEVENVDKNFRNTQIGFIAEDVADIDPRVTVYEQDGTTPKSWDERKFVALLTKAVQVEQHEIEAIDPSKVVHKNKFGRFMDWLEGVQ